MENTKIYKKRIASIVIAAGIALSGTGGYFGISNAIYDSKSKTKIENEIGKENIFPFYSYKVNEKDFVILDVGDHNSIGTSFQDEKMKLCNKEDISLGIMVTSDSLKESDIYNDVEYVKGLIRAYKIDMPVYLNIDKIIVDDSISPIMKEKLIKDFLEKCSANNIYVGIAGTDSNLVRFEKYFDINGYDAYIIQDEKNIKYQGPSYMIKNLDGSITSDKDINLSEVITKRGLNNKKNFAEDGSYEIKESKEELIDLSLSSGMSEKEIYEYNEIKERDIIPGTILRIPTKTNTSNDGSYKRNIQEEELVGCDMSYAQGTNQDWDKLKENFDFIILKCAQGTDLDSCFEENAKNCNNYNIPMGVYCYNNYGLTNCNSIEEFIKKQNKQVEFTLSTLKNKKIDFPVYLDIEAPNGKALSSLLNKEYVNEMLKIWKEKVKEAGYIPGIYCNSSGYEYLSSCVDFDISDCFEVWVAGGDQYTSSKKDIPFEKIMPSGVLEQEGINMAQSTDSAVGAGAGNGKGHLDINFSKVNYEFERKERFKIKEFKRIDLKTSGICAVPVISVLTALGLPILRKRKQKQKARKR